ncbi:MAG: HAMP domain-containing histidine kinase [Lachnospiraceae bacterium]|nr:HAMP domain-containing histidine kinase [Lachnospiraceae bacterium]
MYANIFTILSVTIAALSLFVSARRVRHVNKRLSEISEALEDIKNGNGNRRILSGAWEPTAALAWQINDIVRSYENRLSGFRRMEETNRQLMTSLSHDVRTPLTTLIGYLDAVHKGIVSGQERDDYMETARRKAHDLKEYIDVLFDWFKLGSDEFSLKIVTVDLTGLTRDILVDWIPVLEERQIVYTVHIPELPFQVRLDPDAYLRILNNLIQNVLTHSQADRIELSLSRQEDGNIALTLSDNGKGIEKEDLKHIFDRLYKCDRSRSKKGSGLGLSIVLQLVEKMGGTIQADSTPGTGTIFTLRFPSA